MHELCHVWPWLTGVSGVVQLTGFSGVVQLTGVSGVVQLAGCCTELTGCCTELTGFSGVVQSHFRLSCTIYFTE